MEELRENVKELLSTWEKVFIAMQASPQAWTPHLPYSSPTEINEVMQIIEHLLDRSRAPVGFVPTFRLSKGFASIAVQNALSTAKNLEAGQYNNLPTFLTYLNQILSGFQTMLRFSDSDSARQAIEELGGKLAESISLVHTAQYELSEKLKTLQETEKVAETIEDMIEEIKKHESETKTILENISELKSTAADDTDEIAKERKEIDLFRKEIENEIDHNKIFQKELEESKTKLELLQKESKEVDDLIRALLPGAASAGLAAAFAKRVTQLEKTKWIWMIVFLLSISGLVSMAFVILSQDHVLNQEVWKTVLQRLPFTAPLIWLGWFSAVQYGNTVRVQEDYAFKEATAKAFVGYKDHMDHLSDVNIEDTKSAMKLLATKTIEILSHEPLRIYQNSSEDVSPAKSILESMTGVNKLKPETK